jgi:hypothetical protein
LALLLACLTITASGCGASDDTAFRRSVEECYKNDAREAKQLDKEVGPLLTKKARATLLESSACDSIPEGGASIQYTLQADASLNTVLDKFHTAGWADRQGKPPCKDLCIARVSKQIDGRRIEVSAEEFADGRRVLEALFID